MMLHIIIIKPILLLKLPSLVLKQLQRCYTLLLLKLPILVLK